MWTPALADRRRVPICGTCAVGRVPPPKRSILPMRRPFETSMSPLFAASALCVLAAIVFPLVFSLVGAREGRSR
jgi:hypothetical protein